MNCVPERVGRDGLGDPGAAGGLADDPPGAVPVQPPPVRGQEHRPFGALADGQVYRPGGAWRQRDGDHLAALTGDRHRPVPAFQAQLLDVGTGGFGAARACLDDPVCLMSPPGPRSQLASAVSLRIPRRHVPDADSDLRGYPAPDQRRVLGRRRMCRAKG